MRHSSPRTFGFTLIELLTVIAVISILAAITAVTLPRALERAKIASLEATFNDLRTSMVNYTADHATYPPRYGYAKQQAQFEDPATLTLDDFYLQPYQTFIGQHRNFDVYDNFSESGGTTRNDQLTLLEFSPLGSTNPDGSFSFPNEIYLGPGSLPNLVQQQLNADQRPITYIPVNLGQVKRYATYLRNINPNDPRPRASDPAPNPLANMPFPPPTYDAFVLVSVGPNVNTAGILGPYPEPSGLAPAYRYHVQAIMAYFMATRDADRNGELDFDYIARMRRNEAQNPNNRLPDPNLPNAPGPIIYKSPES